MGADFQIEKIYHIEVGGIVGGYWWVGADSRDVRTDFCTLYTGLSI